MWGNGAYDRAGQGNDGTLTNGPARAPGKIGQGLSFDGSNDYVESTSNVLDPTSGPLTASAWFKTNSITTNQVIIAQLDGTGTGRGWLSINSTGVISSNLGNTVTLGTTALKTNTWYHAVVTKLSGVVTLYLDGQNDGSAARTIESATGVTRIGIGKTGLNPFNGLIDEVRVYNRVLSADEIKRLYNMGR